MSIDLYVLQWYEWVLYRLAILSVSDGYDSVLAGKQDIKSQISGQIVEKKQIKWYTIKLCKRWDSIINLAPFGTGYEVLENGNSYTIELEDS